MKYIKLFIMLIATSFLLYSTIPDTVFDTQTPFAYTRGEYKFMFTVYDKGGLNINTGLGINDYILLGITEFIDGMIGSGKDEWQIPGIYFKIRLLDNPPELFNCSISYNPLYNGTFMEYKERAYGVTTACSKGFFLLASEPHVFSIGLNFPMLPDEARNISETSLFASVVFQINQFLFAATEIENISFKKQKTHNFIWNNTFSFNITDNIFFSFIMQVTDKANGDQSKTSIITSRIVRFSYNGLF